MEDLFGGLIQPRTTRLLVTGGRKFDDVQLAWNVLGQYLKPAMPALEVLIEGEATGLDQIAKQWAVYKGVPVMPFHADWGSGDRAGLERNQRMIDHGRPTTVIGFPGNNGTKHCISRAIEARSKKLVEHVIVVERCPMRWWTGTAVDLLTGREVGCATCARQGFHCVEAQAPA